MEYFVVTRERGPAWDATRRMREQDLWDEHAAFMEALAAEGFIVLGGPLGDGALVLHVVDAPGEEEVRLRLAADPWEPAAILRTASVERWRILLDGR
jgi:uncharacterized protein YciI